MFIVCWLLASEYICKQGFQTRSSTSRAKPRTVTHGEQGKFDIWETIPAKHLLTVLHFTRSAALQRQRATITCAGLSSPKVSGNCVSTVQLCTVSPQTAASFSSASSQSHIFTHVWDKRVIYISLGECSLSTPLPPNPHPLISLALSLTNKSLFNPRLDYNSEVIAWPSSSSPLSEGPAPNLEEQLFINVLLTSLLQCNAAKGSPLGIVLMGRARVRLVKQITANVQRIGLRGDWWGLPLIILHNE